MKRIKPMLLCLSILLATGFAQAETIYYVDDDNTTGPWDGTQANPFQYIQDGIDAAGWREIDTVLVADGIYTGDGNRNLDFGGKTINVKSENDPENCIIDCENIPSAVGFRFQSGEGESAVVDGFTIQNGTQGIY